MLMLFSRRQLNFSNTCRSLSILSFNKNEVRVRFAPSPTGSIHFGGLRTALYNYIFAKQNGGSFILRIEDTDQTRCVPESCEEIEQVLTWAGIKPDEGPSVGGNYGPYVQSKRLGIYQEKIKELLDTNRAYPCFCSKSRLELLRIYQTRNQEKVGYDGKCRNLTRNEVKEKLEENEGNYSVRLAIEPRDITFKDSIFGMITTNLSKSDGDPIIMKSDGWPTYHFANVVDDHTMNISHVFRGAEWIPSTAKHIQLYNAFSWPIPKFGHLPLIKMKDGSKMSKRNNQSKLKHWIDSGYLPLAILNTLTTMGGGLPKDKQDSMDLWDLQKITHCFDFRKIVTNPGMIDLDRLRTYNTMALKRVWQEEPNRLIDQLKISLSREKISNELDEEQITVILDYFISGRIISIEDLVNANHRYLWSSPTLTWTKQDYIYRGWNLKEIIEGIITIINSHDLCDKNSILNELRNLADKHGVDWPSFMRLIRKLLTNRENGQPVYEIFNCLGKKRLLIYLDRGLKYVS